MPRGHFIVCLLLFAAIIAGCAQYFFKNDLRSYAQISVTPFLLLIAISFSLGQDWARSAVAFCCVFAWFRLVIYFTMGMEDTADLVIRVAEVVLSFPLLAYIGRADVIAYFQARK